MSTENKSSNLWVILAPHLIFPLRNGADLYAAGVAKGLSFFSKTFLIGASTINCFENGEIIKTEVFQNRPRSKITSAIISLTTGKSYQEAKFVTSAYKRFVTGFHFNSGVNIAFSFNSTAVLAPLIPVTGGKRVVLTHNFDIAFFKNLQKNLTNPLSKLAAGRTLYYTHRFLQSNQSTFIFAHNNEADEKDYAYLYPAMHHALLKVGVDSPEIEQLFVLRKENLNLGETIKLCFTGYLGGQQNLDALLHFAQVYWPVLLQRFNDKITFTAIGSSPGQPISDLCNKMNWQLLPDLTDDAFAKAVASCHYSVLPFAFTSGTKHKLFTSVAKGVPFLATTNIGVQVSDYPECCLFSNNPLEWANHIKKWQNSLINFNTIESLNHFISEHSWEKTCDDFLNQLSLL